MLKRLIYTIGTGFGTGYSPVAPGTAGSVLAVVLFFLWPQGSLFWLLMAILFFALGVPVASAIEKERGEDPSLEVIDEVVGQWLALIFLPAMSWKIATVAFLLFRLFDIWKPFPIDYSQQLKGGWGVMVDDVLAGVYANLVLQFVLRSGLF